MPGLLEMFGGSMSEPQKQGLLAAAAQMLQASGSSLRPVGFGQVVGSGVGAYQQAKAEAEQNALRNEAVRQNSKFLGLKIQDAESDLKAQEAARGRSEGVRQAISEYFGAAGSPNAPLSGQHPGSKLGTVLSGGANPTVEQQRTQPQVFDRSVLAQQRIMLAQHLRSKGFAQEAQAEEDSALKLMPKVKEWQKVQQGGKVMYAPYFEDGSSGSPVPLEVAEKLEFQNMGGKALALNPFTGGQVSSYANSIDPNTAATVGIQRERLNFEKSQAGKPVYDSDRGVLVDQRRGIATPVQTVQGAQLGPKDAPQKVADAKDVLSLLDQAAPLVKQATGSYGGAALDQAGRVFGIATDSGNKAAQLKAIEGVLISKMPKMSGPQSDKDVAMYRQMAGQIGDPTVPESTKLAAMDTIREIAMRNAGGQSVAQPERKVATLADIAATAKASGRSTAEVTAALRAKGYTIGGQ